jgi:hypothetical protein
MAIITVLISLERLKQEDNNDQEVEEKETHTYGALKSHDQILVAS